MSDTPTQRALSHFPPRGSELQFGRILVPVDFSVGTATQVRIARELARSWNGTLLLLHVREPFLDAVGSLEPPDTSDFHLMLEAMKLDLTRSGYEVELRSVKGSAGSEIVRIANEEKADIIVMGTHGRTGLRHVLLGSVAEHVVRRARCPVLTLRLSDGAHLDRSASDRV